MRLIQFKFSGKFGHFLRAEANASAPSYPFPPRTALLGVMAAILGLGKDEAPIKLEPCSISLQGEIPARHWHTVKLRKDPPAPLPWEVKKTQKSEKQTAPEKATLIAQEWLWRPDFLIWAGLPGPFQAEFEARLRERRWHFPPSMGLSELSADVLFMNAFDAVQLPKGAYTVSCAFRRESAEIDYDAVFSSELALQAIRLPRFVTPDRVFTHADYFIEMRGRSVPVVTSEAWQAGEDHILLL